MKRYIQFILAHRIYVLGLILLLTGAALIPLSSAVIGTSLGQLFFGNSPEYERYLEISTNFGNDEILVIGIEGQVPLSLETLDRLEKIEEELLKSPEVQSVQSAFSAQWIRVDDEGSLRISRFSEEIRNDPTRREELSKELADGELTKGLLLSKDHEDTAIIIELKSDSNRAAENGPAMVKSFLQIFVDAGFPKDSLHLAGMQEVLAEVMTLSFFSMTHIFPISSVMLFLIVFLLFRRVWPALVSGANALIAIIWCMGFSCALDPQINIMLSVVPAVISVVSFADVIHLCSAYLIELGENKSKEEAIVDACTDVGRACLFTSVTTFLGFVGISFVPTPAFRQLGMVLGFGTGVALLIAITLVPIVLYYLPTPSPSKGRVALRVDRILESFLTACARLSVHRPKAIIAVFLSVAALMFVGLSQFTIETSFTDRLAEDNPVAMDQVYFKESFSTSHLLPVLISSPEKEGVLQPEFFQALAELSKKTEAMKEVHSATSLVDLIGMIHVPFTADDEGATPLPTSREAIAQYLLLFEMEGGEELEKIVDFSRESTMMLVRLEEGKMRASKDVAQQIIQEAAALFPPGTQIEPTGQLYLTGSWLDEILDGQKMGLLFTCLSIALVMIIGLRSFGVGLLSMIPNLFPLICLGGFLGLTQETSDSDILIIALLAISIGVDDTIHFLMRYKIESERLPTSAEAIERTFAFAGRGILITTITLSVGFAPFLLSDYLSTRIFGTFLPMVFIVALLADVLFLPALAKVGVISFAR